MLSAIKDSELDLYNKEAGLYVWKYNDVGSIAYADLFEEDAEELREKAAECDECWSAFLGGGEADIVDDPDYEDFEEGDYSNLDWCNQNYEGEWEDVTP